MPFRNQFLLTIFISLASIPSLAQENFRAVHWGAEEKKPDGWAVSLIKDAHGFIWIGTGGFGLVRFDGSNFKNYRYEINKNRGEVDDDIRGLIEDSLHNIWFGTESGLYCYDINADTFKRVAPAIKNPFGLSLAPFWATKEEVFCWNYTESQWSAFNIHSLKKRFLAKMSREDQSSWYADRFSVYDAGSNSIWIEKDSSGSFAGGLLQVSLSTGEKKPFAWNCFRKISNHNHSFDCMHYDRNRNVIWINSEDGPVEFALSDKSFHHDVAFDSLLRQKNYHAKDGLNIDGLGRIWAGTFPAGIVIYNPSDQSVKLPFANDTSIQQRISKDNFTIYYDRDGIMWSGCANELHQLIPFSPPVSQFISEPRNPNSLSSNFAVFCLDAGQGKIWIGTGDGLNIFDNESGLFRVLQKNDLPGLNGEIHEIHPISIDTSTQKAWILAGNSYYQKGMLYYQMDLRSKKCIPIIFKDSNNQNVAIDGGFPRPFKNGSVLAVDYGNRFLVFIGNSDSLVSKQILSFPKGSIEGFSIASDEDHMLFFRQNDSSFNLSYIFDHGKWTLIHTALDSIHWANIIFNKRDQTYWVNSENKIVHLSRDFQLIWTYTQKDGLPDGDKSWIIPDNYGNAWFTTDHSLHRLDIQSGRISMLTEKDGFRVNGFYVGLQICKSSTGEIYIPSGVGGKGFTRIRPDKYINQPSFVYIQSLLVNQQPYQFFPGMKNEPEISMKYYENRFTIEPGIIDLNSAGKNQFRYKLGESSEWIYPYSNIIYYDNVSPGNYDLIMQASNSNVFNGPATILRIRISPPWWQTWWAYTLFAIAFVCLLWLFIQYRSRALREKNIQLEEKVIHRTKELKHSLEELRETQNQLIQREKMASLGELTAGIAHEIQNPMNFINNFSEVNRELIHEMNEAFNKENFSEAKVIANDIEQNTDKIIYHGKRADNIVKGMMLHSRAGSGVKEPSDINALAEEYLRLSYHGLRAKDKSFNASMETSFDDSIEKINIIPQDIGRVLLNLFNNSFYSVNEKKKSIVTDDYEPKVRITTKNLLTKIELKVWDNGIGISKKIIDKIFQPFFTTKPTGEGTGLGLSLSYDIITKVHSGEIKVESEEGDHTEFTIIIPK
jgi:signal transduction histidine kinase/ligand-binding sensor domain-containing protein